MPVLELHRPNLMQLEPCEICVSFHLIAVSRSPIKTDIGKVSKIDTGSDQEERLHDASEV